MSTIPPNRLSFSSSARFRSEGLLPKPLDFPGRARGLGHRSDKKAGGCEIDRTRPLSLCQIISRFLRP
ncbi:hypothetical protein HMPREF0262_02031 [Clostridium sp. ATCC 29733]|nr:hypothetical protein HMPREF0262_02031 [Clostridium sp. ATCC 29733]